MIHRSNDVINKMPSLKSLNDEHLRYQNLKKINPNLNLVNGNTLSNNLSINSSVNNSINGLNSATLKNMSQQFNNTSTSSESVQYPAMQLYDSLMSKANDGRLLLLLNYLSSNHKSKLNQSVSSKDNKPKPNESKSKSAEYLKQQQIQKKLTEKLKTCVSNGNCATTNRRHKIEPMTPEQALKIYGNKLTKFEQTEILNYPQIYYVGENAKKVQAVAGSQYNNGFDDKNGRYKLFQYDHVQYRFKAYFFHIE